jgi:hypothetical protein
MNQQITIIAILSVITVAIGFSCLMITLDLQNQLDQKTQQITKLENQIVELENDLGNVKEGEWNLIDSFGGSSGTISDYFFVSGNELRLTWTAYNGLDESVSFNIEIFKEGQTEPLDSLLNLDDQGSTLIPNIEKGNYYLTTSGENVDQWSITIETWIAPN